MIHVGAVDDHPVVLEGVARVLERTAPDLRLVAVAPSVDALHEQRGDFDVVLLDIRLEDGSAPSRNAARLTAGGARVVVYTDGARSAQIYNALSGGALSVVLKEEPVEALVEAVRAAHRGDAVVSPRLAQALDTAPDLDRLITPQERQVLRLYAGGLPAKSVARRMGLQEETVKEYLKRIRAKLDGSGLQARTKLELRDVAESMGLFDEPDAPRATP